jgi:hypothetical protein
LVLFQLLDRHVFIGLDTFARFNHLHRFTCKCLVDQVLSELVENFRRELSEMTHYWQWD